MRFDCAISPTVILCPVHIHDCPGDWRRVEGDYVAVQAQIDICCSPIAVLNNLPGG
jgi:hypothetical protein